MACKTSSIFFAWVFVITILLAVVGHAAAGRNVPTNQANDDQMKHPEFLLKHDRSVLIPGLGRVLFPPAHHTHSHYKDSHGGTHTTYTGSNGGIPTPSTSSPYPGSIGGSTGGTSYVPGGDDTFVPNPGFEVPVPGSGGSVVP